MAFYLLSVHLYNMSFLLQIEIFYKKIINLNIDITSLVVLSGGHFGGQAQLSGPNFWPPVWPPKWPSAFITVRLGGLVRGLKKFWPHQWPFVRFPTLFIGDKWKYFQLILQICSSSYRITITYLLQLNMNVGYDFFTTVTIVTLTSKQ
ncbi:hypothetical protein BpHYR1_033450 [Brachionus plicatilis]|uniref:Uncharacterized protein n=1 Tax=Brachionus plicatilis TaxID=10195 RepID=A0A3M7PWD8_BRAPC|nr:hypothetical protein BpHYR1_033450 [Brachionus plicatilis]